jgi:hypothetical protein
MKQSGVHFLVRQWMIEHPGKPVTTQAVARAAGIREVSSANAALRALLAEGEIERVAHGTYRRPAPPAPEQEPVRSRMFEEIGMAQDGRIICRSTDGDGLLYTFTQL